MDLPHVLLIGDSISIGYTQPVRTRMQDICNIHRPKTNCASTTSGLANIDLWLGDRKWDIIHFNWGLHDLCYRHPESTVYGNRDKVRGSLSVEPEQYRENIEQLVLTMQPRARRLIWASTTYIPEGEAGRHQGDDEQYNALAAQVMDKYEIPINDLHKVTKSFPPAMFTSPGDVHYTDDGSELVADAVAACIVYHLTTL